MSAAAARASRTDLDDPGTSLLNQVVAVQSASRAVAFDDYRAEYDEHQAEFFVSVTAGIDSFYQQMHAATATAARLVGRHAAPKIDVKTLAALQAELERSPEHPLAPRLRAIRRQVGLLRWLSTVRNKAVQHRAEEGYLGNRGMVLQSGIAIMRKPGPPAPADARKAKDLLRGLIRKYAVPLDPGEGDYEAVAYLDFLSHALFATEKSDFDTARRVIEDARVHNLIVCVDLVNNADTALAALIDLVPPNPTSPATA